MQTPSAAPPTERGPAPARLSPTEQYLRLLSIFYYVIAALVGLGGCFSTLYLGFGVLMLVNPDIFSDPQLTEERAKMLGGTIAGLSGVFMLASLVSCVLMVQTGRAIARRRRWRLCMVTAGIACLWAPLGTALGIFTFVVAGRGEGRSMFK